jgi:hypothetical protein
MHAFIEFLHSKSKQSMTFFCYFHKNLFKGVKLFAPLTVVLLFSKKTLKTKTKGGRKLFAADACQFLSSYLNRKLQNFSVLLKENGVKLKLRISSLNCVSLTKLSKNYKHCMEKYFNEHRILVTLNFRHCR